MMPIPELTLRERSTLAFVRRYHAEKGYAPSIREISKALGVQSTSLVSWYLEKLVRAGYVERDPAVARGIRIVERTE